MTYPVACHWVGQVAWRWLVVRGAELARRPGQATGRRERAAGLRRQAQDDGGPGRGPRQALQGRGGDAPASFFSAFGLGTEQAEPVFPLSSVLALHGCWQHNPRPETLRAEPRVVQESYERVASGAARFIFYRDDRDWVLQAGAVAAEQLNRINWSPQPAPAHRRRARDATWASCTPGRCARPPSADPR